MPKSTMHLWVAKKISDNMKFEAGASYLLGNIAPDSFTIRQGRTKEDKKTAHLRQPYFADGYKNAKKILTDYQGNDFLKGCALHIMLDDIWTKGPYYNMLTELEKKLGKKEAQIAYLRDMEYVEAWLFRQSASRALWSAVINAPLERYYDILTPGEIDDFRKQRYKDLNAKKNIAPSVYITLDVVYDFMDRAAEKLSAELKNSL